MRIKDMLAGKCVVHSSSIIAMFKPSILPRDGLDIFFEEDNIRLVPYEEEDLFFNRELLLWRKCGYPRYFIERAKQIIYAWHDDDGSHIRYYLPEDRIAPMVMESFELAIMLSPRLYSKKPVVLQEASNE